MSKKKILVTGGAGFIGSHIIIQLHSAGFESIIVDNFSNARCEVLKRLEKIIGQEILHYNCDISSDKMEKVFDQHDIYAVIHCAAMKAVGESVQKPLEYYENNVGKTVQLLKLMQRKNVHRFIFSSSATVYGSPEYLPIDEKHPVGRNITNPYGQTKYMVECILNDLKKSQPSLWKIVILRYFNPVGADVSGTIGEDPKGIPNNLMPFISHVAVGRQPKLKVFGNDYDTIDGTGVRDYIHVVDLARGHVNAIDRLDTNDQSECLVYNLGTGVGYSVLQMLSAYSDACGKILDHEMAPRRDGDVASVFCDPKKALEELGGWKATAGIKEMCEDQWRWQSQNPNGIE